ncbi:MAG: DinB family protein [Pseudomonadota bacterium]
MISAAYCREMARYNAWQNTGLREAMLALPEREVTAERGAFFGSLLGTANHLLWGDTMWMSRFDGWAPPSVPGKESAAFMADAQSWAAARLEADARIGAWAVGLGEADLAGTLTWYSGAAGRELSKSRAVCIVQFFNHQTHHRGQIHKMLTELGHRPGDTDFFLMPDP